MMGMETSVFPSPVSSDETWMTGSPEKAMPGDGARSGGVTGIEELSSS